MNKVWSVAIAVVALSGCHVVAGVEDRSVDPIRDGCTLPTTGDATLRFANLVPAEGAVDLCIRATGGEFTRPVLRGGGSKCPSGFTYPQESAKFAIPSGKIDVKVVKAGSTCSAPALSSVDGVNIASGSATVVVRMGNEQLGEKLTAYPEATSRSRSGTSKFRFIHASPGSPPLDIAVANEKRLPSDLGQPLFAKPYAFGDVTSAENPALFGTPQADGYVEGPGTVIYVGAAPTGTKRANIVAEIPDIEAGRTMFFIGDPAKPYFPVRALTCEETEVDGPLLTKCTQSPLGTLSVGTYNAYLYGPFAPNEDLRRKYVFDGIVGHNADLMCITAISRKEDREALIAQAKAAGSFAYSITHDSNLDTPATDPRDQSGKTPDSYQVAACGGTVTQAEVDAAMGCIKSKCSTTGGPDGYVKGGSECISSSCASAFIPFLAGDQNHKRCFNCLIISSLSDEVHAETQATCTTDVRDYKAFKGQTSSMVLSRYELKDMETYVLPSTSYQRVVHYAKVAIERDKSVDFFCGELTAAFGELVPYHGFYAPDPDPNNDKWYQEQLHQAKRVIEYVKRKAEGRPAIIAGDWATSLEYTSPDGKIKIDDQNGAVIKLFDESFVPAVPPNYIPICTECAAPGLSSSMTGGGPANPYNGNLSIWQFHTYLYGAGLPASSAVGANLFLTDSVVPMPSGEKYPRTDRWGYEVQIVRP